MIRMVFPCFRFRIVCFSSRNNAPAELLHGWDLLGTVSSYDSSNDWLIFVINFYWYIWSKATHRSMLGDRRLELVNIFDAAFWKCQDRNIFDNHKYSCTLYEGTKKCDTDVHSRTLLNINSNDSAWHNVWDRQVCWYFTAHIFYFFDLFIIARGNDWIWSVIPARILVIACIR